MFVCFNGNLDGSSIAGRGGQRVGHHLPGPVQHSPARVAPHLHTLVCRKQPRGLRSAGLQCECQTPR